VILALAAAHEGTVGQLQERRGTCPSMARLISCGAPDWHTLALCVENACTVALAGALWSKPLFDVNGFCRCMSIRIRVAAGEGLQGISRSSAGGTGVEGGGGRGLCPMPPLVSLALGELAQTGKEVGHGLASAWLAALNGTE